MTDAARHAPVDHSALASRVEELLPRIDELAPLPIETYAAGRRLYTFGNGVSAADAQHFAAELVGRYDRDHDRGPLAASALSVDPSVVTSISNDYAFAEVFARQVRAFARPEDVVVGFATFGRARRTCCEGSRREGGWSDDRSLHRRVARSRSRLPHSPTTSSPSLRPRPRASRRCTCSSSIS